MTWKWMPLCVASLALVLGAGSGAQQPAELIIRNGLIVTAVGRTEGDVRIRSGTVVEIGRNLPAAAGAREIDATGKLVIPGGVDPHTHIAKTTPTARASSDDYATASAAAFAGGVTTISNFVNPEALENALALIQKQAMADVFLHIFGDAKTVSTADLAAYAARGIGVKFFTSRPTFEQDPLAWLNFLRAGRAAGILFLVHAEDYGIVTATGARMVAEGRGALRYYGESRPDWAEEVAVHRVVAMAEDTGAPIYFVHLSSERALRAAEAGMARGLPVYVETLSNYLHETKEIFAEPEGALHTHNPPPRTKRDMDALWAGIARGTVHTVATDHSPWTKQEKLEDRSLDVINGRPGEPHLQEYIPMLYSEGVRKGRITLEKMIAVTSTNPAKLFGLYPRKGTIGVGSDADVVIWDPNLTRTIRDEDALSNAKYSLFSGWEVTGWPVTTIRRGEIVYQNGKVTASPGSGKLAPRNRWQSVGLP